MNSEIQTMMRDAAEHTNDETENPWKEHWTGLTLEEALVGSQVIEDVDVNGSRIRIYLEESPRYITETVEIHEVGLFYENGTEQRFPFGFDMAGQVVEHEPSTAIARVKDATVRVVSVIQTDSDCRNTTSFQVPLDTDGDEIVLDEMCSRAGYEEYL